MIKAFALQLAALKKQVRALSSMTIEGYGRSGGGASGGLSFTRSIAPSENAFYVPPRTVVIVEAPAPSDMSLKVREVRYANYLPQKCTGAGTLVDPKVCHYAWEGSTFDAYPPLGRDIMEYAGDEFTGAVGLDPPGFDAVYHEVQFKFDRFVLDAQAAGGGVSFAVVRETYNPPDHRIVGVHEVAWDGSDTPMILGGPLKVIRVWPGLVSANYAAFRWIGDYAPQTVVIGAANIGGRWYAEQWPGLRFQLEQRDRDARITDCIPQA